MEQNNKIVLFQEKKIRRVWDSEEWYYSIGDIIGILTNSTKPRDYWSVLKKREPQLPTICRQLKLASAELLIFLYQKIKLTWRKEQSL